MLAAFLVSQHGDKGTGSGRYIKPDRNRLYCNHVLPLEYCDQPKARGTYRTYLLG
jgi:hypothetical protein